MQAGGEAFGRSRGPWKTDYLVEWIDRSREKSWKSLSGCARRGNRSFGGPLAARGRLGTTPTRTLGCGSRRLLRSRRPPAARPNDPMQYTPRTIAFLSELLHPPLEPDTGPIQRVHNRLFESGVPIYRSYTETPEGAVLSNPQTQPGAVSSAAFLRDRFQFREEMTGGTLEEFNERLRRVLELVLAERPIQLFTAQMVTVRTLVNPRQFRDSRRFLRSGLFRFGPELEGFGSDPELYGMRLVFPPSEESPQAFNLRVESFASDPRSIFIENCGTFGPTVVAHGTEPLQRNVEATYEFIVQRALPFLSHFDERLPT